MDKMRAAKEQIQEAIVSLPGNERASLLKWLVEMDRLVWDGEIEKDFSESGAGAALLDRVKKDFEAGRCSKVYTPLNRCANRMMPGLKDLLPVKG